jgi:hypothetical protein
MYPSYKRGGNRLVVTAGHLGKYQEEKSFLCNRLRSTARGGHNQISWVVKKEKRNEKFLLTKLRKRTLPQVAFCILEAIPNSWHHPQPGVQPMFFFVFLRL